MATSAALSYSIKVPVHAKIKRESMPPVAARLQARDFPARSPTTPEKQARRELIIASEKARKAAVAAAHNARVNDTVNNATLMKTQINEYTRTSTDRRLQEAEANRVQQLNERAGKAKKFVQRVDTVAEKNESRKADLAAQTSRKLEAAKQLRERKLATVQFKAADATARGKSIALNAAKDAEHKARRIKGKAETAAQRRDRFLNLVASKAAFYNARHERNVEHVRANSQLEARVAVVQLESKMAAAEYLRTLDLRLRQSKAALTNERAAMAVERQRFASYAKPMMMAKNIRDSQSDASERRADAMTHVVEKAHGFVRRAVMTCAVAELKAKVHTETMRAHMEERLAAAAERKGDLLARDVTAMAGGGPSPSPPKRGGGGGRPQRAHSAIGFHTARRRLSESPRVGAGGTVFRPPSPGSPYYTQQLERDLLAEEGRRSRAGVKRSRHSIAGGEGSFSVPTSPVGA